VLISQSLIVCHSSSFIIKPVARKRKYRKARIRQIYSWWPIYGIRSPEDCSYRPGL